MVYYEGYIDPKIPNPNGPADAPFIIYGYTPSLALSILGATLFFISFLLHTYQVFRHRTWYFIPMAIGTLMEIVGYIARSFSSKKDPYNVNYFVIQYFFIVVAPVFFSAAIYTILTKLMRRTTIVGGGHSSSSNLLPINPRPLLSIFIISDVIATVVQIAGAASIGAAESKRRDPTTANNILLAGLAFQVFTFLVFLVLLVLFLYRARKVVTAALMPFSAALLVATCLIYLRTCFRLAETAEGLGGTLSTHEVFFGCLEFAPVVVAVFLFNWWHPGKWVSTSDRPTSTREMSIAEETQV
ncbi:MAG: hypothetical protein M1816_006631 [Peltula sp. TS41687]|nr:MAG: hypothetical protein M1816_006631 [Peltula sp. TS41687]